ncbi:MAG: DUF4116 domain-containing protein, partial [Bacteroidota bacterium]
MKRYLIFCSVCLLSFGETFSQSKDEIHYWINQLNNDADLSSAPSNIVNNRAVVLAAVNQYGNALQYASESLQGDTEIVLAAVKQNGYALH